MRENTDQEKLRIWILFTQCVGEINLPLVLDLFQTNSQYDQIRMKVTLDCGHPFSTHAKSCVRTKWMTPFDIKNVSARLVRFQELKN